MPYDIVFSPAEDIVGVVDAVLAKSQNCTLQFISEFADISTQQASNALFMAQQLNLVNCSSDGNTYESNSYLARLIVSSRDDNHKAAIMRLVLEQYEPYIHFKNRYTFTNSLDLASKQVKAIFSMNSSHKDIKNTFISIGTYSKSMINDGANSYKFNQDDVSYIEILELAIKFKLNDDNALLSQLGDQLYDFLDKDNVFKPLSDSYSKIQDFENDSKSVILYAGNAFESFLCQIATINNISLIGKSGIKQKSDALSSVLSKKHRGMIEYIAQVRNASDHGSNPDENNQTWSVSEETAQIYPIIVTSLIKDIFSYINGKLIV